MDLSMILPVVYGLVGLALVWFVVELALIVRKAREMVGDITNQVKPMLANVEQITDNANKTLAQVDPLMAKVNQVVADAQPAVVKIPPLMDRVALTIDAANLELMRVDQILENVGEITQSASKAAGAVDTVTSAPVDIVSTLTDRLRTKFKTRAASEESVAAGASKERKTKVVADAVNAVSDAAAATMTDTREKAAARKAKQAERDSKAKQQEQVLDNTAEKLTDAMVNATGTDTPGV